MARNAVTTECGALAINPPDGSGVRAFKGIPYAAPPVGPLRWRPPQPCAPWKGVRPTHVFGPNSLQGVVFGDIDPLAAGVSEDCLYLNIWTPANLAADEKLAVLFWIHGGGFVVGSGAEPRYDGARLAARGIVVVTVNHRLNALGFLAHPGLSAESTDKASGNYGMLDLVAALRWIKSNIAQLGGDPQQVTIAGESAGSMAVSGLMASPLARGLFARAIGESGGLFSSPTEPLITRSEAERKGSAFAEKLGAKTAADLRALPAAAILDAAPGLGFRPTIDGAFLPETPAAIFAAGEQSDVPLLAGWNRDEGFNFSVLKWGDGKTGLADWVRNVFGEKARDAFSHYPDASPDLRAKSARDLGGDLIINHGTWSWIEAHKTHGKADVFRYRFDHAPDTPEGWLGPGDTKDAGAFHSCEILYVFDNLDAFPWRIAKEDEAVAERAASYWLNFVKTGNPNGDGAPHWPSNREPDSPTLLIDAQIAIANDLDGAKHRFLATALPPA